MWLARERLGHRWTGVAACVLATIMCGACSAVTPATPIGSTPDTGVPSPVAASSPSPTVPAATPTPVTIPTRPPTGTPVWTTTAVALDAGAGVAASAEAHVGAYFPLKLAGETTTVAQADWAAVTWQTPGRHGTAWVPAADLATVAPARSTTASLDALDSALASYVGGLGDRVGVEVDDLTRRVTYSDDATRGFIVASSIKVPIMLAFLTKLEAAHREPTATEMTLLRTMIENSNNDSAQDLYEAIGDAPGMTAYMRSLGIGGLIANHGAWGWSTITPAAMIAILGRLEAGTVLTAHDRTLALELLEHVEHDQQVGVGSTAPAASTVALKDGWVVAPDGRWVMNSSGIVKAGSETYLISVYTADDTSLAQGEQIVSHICAVIASRLVSGS